MVSRILIPYRNRVQWPRGIEVDNNLMVQLEKRHELAWYYILKHGKKSTYNFEFSHHDAHIII